MMDNLKDRAEAQFKKKQREIVQEGDKARAEYEAARQADRDKTWRLREARLAKEAADLSEATAKKEMKDKDERARRKRKPAKQSPPKPKIMTARWTQRG